MKRKEKFYIDIKQRKICKGSEYQYNTLTINTTKLKWDKIYRQRCIDRFATILKQRNEIKPVRIKYQPKKKYCSNTINHKTKGVYVSRTEINIINRNEQTIKIINEIKGL